MDVNEIRLPQKAGMPNRAISAYIEFWIYTYGWLVRASQQVSREDINKPALVLLDHFKNAQNGGFFTHRLDLNDNITE